jgi:hypothetical protein
MQVCTSSIRGCTKDPGYLVPDGDDFDDALPRRALVGGYEEEPHVNPDTGTMEFALRDTDGDYVMIWAMEAD